MSVLRFVFILHTLTIRKHCCGYTHISYSHFINIFIKLRLLYGENGKGMTSHMPSDSFTLPNLWLWRFMQESSSAPHRHISVQFKFDCLHEYLEEQIRYFRYWHLTSLVMACNGCRQICLNSKIIFFVK